LVNASSPVKNNQPPSFSKKSRLAVVKKTIAGECTVLHTRRRG
jgi:hypothetical protein